MTQTTNNQRQARRISWVLVLLVLAASAWLVLWPHDKGSDLEKALCADLDAGYLVHQIRGDFAPERFAQTVYTATKDVCPEHRDRQDVQRLLEAWDLDG